MAGHVRVPMEGRRHELSYSPGDAVPFTTAEYDVDIDHLIADDSVPVQVVALAPLVPRLRIPALAVCTNKADGAAFAATPARGRRNSM